MICMRANGFHSMFFLPFFSLSFSLLCNSVVVSVTIQFLHCKSNTTYRTSEWMEFDAIFLFGIVIFSNVLSMCMLSTIFLCLSSFRCVCVWAGELVRKCIVHICTSFQHWHSSLVLKLYIFQRRFFFLQYSSFDFFFLRFSIYHKYLMFISEHFIISIHTHTSNARTIIKVSPWKMRT